MRARKTVPQARSLEKNDEGRERCAPLSLVGAEWPHGGAVMADLLYLALGAVFFWLTWLLVRLCERL